MTTLTPRLAPHAIADAHRPTPAPLTFGRAVAVEARKLVDTGASLALALALVPLMAAFAFGRAVAPAPDTTLAQLVGVAALPASWIVMVLSVLLVATEFTRTAGVTFTLDPVRARVLTAKAAVVVALGVAATVTAVVLGVAAGLVVQASGHGVPLTLSAGRVVQVAGALVFTGLTALAWGLATRSIPAPLVVLLVWPTLALLLARFSDAAAAALSWINIDAVWALSEPTPTAWAQLATSVAFWILAPAALGAWRLLRGDL